MFSGVRTDFYSLVGFNFIKVPFLRKFSTRKFKEFLLGTGLQDKIEKRLRKSASFLHRIHHI